ncbi:hypothetical protein [uncultured Cohaesibacter sp.]|uniref:hypothetical protein n=1 Tax=uncultured Cohaesibacter sp. TaxID=1002546 RepID=UPI00292DD2AB|nr:hypothetical protein [uncultured Cohaesibacter sp.]
MFAIWRERVLDLLAAKRRESEKAVSLRGRFDLIFVGLGAALLLLLLVLGYGIASGQARFGWFDAASFRSVADERLSANIRSEDAEKSGPFVATASLSKTNHLAVLREQGLLHTLNLTTGLWSDNDELKQIDGIGSSFVDLSTACSTQTGTALEDCEDPDALFAYSADNGLAFRFKDRWQTLIPDSRFKGLSGNWVEQNEITHAAVTGDERWLLLTTRSEGLGLFNLKQRIWVPLSEELQQGIFKQPDAPGDVTLASMGQAFLIGTQKGLVVLELDDVGEVETLETIEAAPGHILDIAVSGDEALLLARKDCEDAGCLKLYSYEAEGGVTELFGEASHYPDLSQARLSRAFLSQDKQSIFTLGSAGVYRYDRQTRGWTRLWDQPTSVYLEGPAIDGIYFASPGQVGHVDPSGTIKHWAIEGQGVVSLTLAQDGALVVQTADNQTWRVANGKATRITDGVPAREALSQMKRAVSAFGQVVLIGEKYLVLHDPKDRSYQSIDKLYLPDGLLFGKETQLVGGPGVLWAVSGDEMEAYRLVGSGAASEISRVARRPFQMTPRAVHGNGDGLLVVSSDGIPYRFELVENSIEERSLIGRVGKETGPIGDVWLDGDLTYLARRDKVSVYSSATRGYVDTVAMPVDEAIREITTAQSSLYLLGDRGGLVSADQRRRMTGSDAPFSFASSEITDALGNRAELFLASKKGVAVYSPRARGLVRHYAFQASNTVRLSGLAESVPIAYDGQNAWLGDQALSVDGAQVISAGLAGETVATVQTDSDTVFLARHEVVNGKAAPPVCYYRNPGPANDRITDVASLEGNRIIALVGGILWLRDQPHRRFVGFRIAETDLPTSAKIAILGQYLVAHTEQQAWIVPLGRFVLPDSCSRALTDLTQFVTVVNAAELAVSTGGHAIGLLGENGSYGVWKNGKFAEQFAATDSRATSPNPVGFQSADTLKNALYFANGAEIWRYLIPGREWSRLSLDETGAEARAVDVWAHDDKLVVTLDGENGEVIGGVVDPALSTKSLSPLRQWSFPDLPFEPQSLADVALLDDGSWLFLGDDNLAVARHPNSDEAYFPRPLSLPPSKLGRKVFRQNGQTLVVEGDEAQPRSILVLPNINESKRDFSNGETETDFFYLQPREGERHVVLDGSRLLKQGADGAVELCRGHSGKSDYSDCSLVVPAGLTLDPGEIVDAYKLDETQWLLQEKSGALILIDRVGRQRRDIEGVFARIAAVYRGASGLLIEDVEGALFSLDLANASMVRVVSNFRSFVSLADLDVIQYDKGILLLGDDAITDYNHLLGKIEGYAEDGKVRDLDVWEDGLSGQVEIDGHLQLIFSDQLGRLRDDDILSLPGASALPGQFDQVVPVSKGRWLLVADDAIFDVTRGSCPTTAQETGGAQGAGSSDAFTDCVVIKSRYGFPKALTGTKPYLQSFAENGFVLDGRLWKPGNCSKIALEGDGLGREETRMLKRCLLRKTDDLVSPSHLAEKRIFSRQNDLFAAIDQESHVLDKTRLEDDMGGIRLAIGEFEITRFNGSVSFEQAPAAKTASYRWQRDGRAFVFTDLAGASFVVPPEEAMPQGRFAFAWPGRAVMLDADRYMVVNRFGKWIYKKGLVEYLRWHPLPLLNETVGAGRGRVFFADNRSIGETDAGLVKSQPVHSMSSGALRIEADVIGKKVAAIWSDGEQDYQAFSRRGFYFDERLDFAFADGKGWFLTPVGLVGADSLSDNAPLPDARIVGATSFKDQIYVVDRNGNWLATEMSDWKKTASPYENRFIAEDEGLVWQYQKGRLLTRSSQRNMSDERRLGLRFESDILFNAAYSDAGLLIQLGDGLRLFPDFDALKTARPATISLPSNLLLDVRPMQDGGREIVALDERGRLARRWDGRAFVSIPNAQNPDRYRVAVKLDWLRVVFDAGRPSIDLLSTSPSGTADWVPIGWRAGQTMPFDRFTAIHGVGNKLLAGTSVGLQLLEVSEGHITNQTFVLLRDRAIGRDALEEVSDAFDDVLHIGQFMGHDAGAYILGRGGCLRWRDGALSACSGQEAFDRESLGRNSFWEWMRQNGEITLTYLDADNHPLGLKMAAPVNGRFPHDMLEDVQICDGMLAQSWGGNLTILSDGVDLRKGTSFAVEDGESLSLVCQTRDIDGSRSDPDGLAKGLYVKGKGLWRWTGEKLVRAEESRPSLTMREGGKTAYESKRLRIRNEPGLVRFEYRRNDSWEALKANGGRLDIDQLEGLVSSDGHVWAYTQEGFVTINSLTGGLDPDNFALVALDGDDDAACSYDVAETADDRLSHLPSDEEKPSTYLRCRDGRVFRGRLVAQDQGQAPAMSSEAEDPFLSRNIFADDTIAIRRIGRSTGREGSLQFTWRGEENGLSGGRFALDDISQIALIAPDKVELTTGLGWVRQSMGIWNEAGAERPVNRGELAAKTKSISLDMDVDRILHRERPHSTSLCLLDDAGSYHRWWANGRVEQVLSCDGIEAFDGIFAYRASDKGTNGLRITSASLNGSILGRRLERGRFSDLTISGHAILARLDGKPVVAFISEKRVSLFDPVDLREVGGWSWTQQPDFLFVTQGGEIGVFAKKVGGSLKAREPLVCTGLDGVISSLEQKGSASSIRGVEWTGTHAYAHLETAQQGLTQVALDCDGKKPSIAGDWSNLDRHTRYLSHFEMWGRPSPLLRLWIEENGDVMVSMDGRQKRLSTLVGKPHFARLVGDRFILVNSNEIFEAELAPLLSDVMESVRQ